MNKQEQTRERVKRYRERKNSVTSGSVTSSSVTRPNMMGEDGPIWKENEYNPEEIWEGQPRYIGPFTDGQVLDRKTPNTSTQGPGAY